MLPLDPYTARTSNSQSITKHGDEQWHVAVSWDDIKLMNVDQLDDAFRLDIINSETSVWKPGMGDWQPLRVVAGLGADEDDEEEVMDDEVEFVWPQAAAAPRVPPAPKLVPVAQSWPPPSTQSRTAEAWPPPNTQRAADAWPQSTRSAATDDWLTPRGAPVYAAPAPVVIPSYDTFGPRSTVPAHVSPVAFTLPPPRAASGGFGRWLLGIAFLGGMLVTLYRNDLLLEGARRAHLEDQYFKVERTLLGGPGFGTLRALAGLESANTDAPVPAVQPPAPSMLATAAPTPTAESAPAAKAEVTPPAQTAAPTPAAVPTTPPVVALKTTPAPVAAAVPAKAVVPVQKPIARATPVRTQAAAAPAPAATKATAVKLDEESDSDSSVAVAAHKATKEAPAKKVATKDESVAKPAKPVNVTEGVAMPKSTLMDAISQAAKRKTPKGKNSQYDPLNGDL